MRYLFGLAAMLLFAIGCGGGGDDGGGTAVADPPLVTNSAANASSGSSNATQAEAESPLPSVIASGKVEFRVGDGEEVFSFKPSGDSAAKFYDQSGTELCKLTFSGSRKLKVKSGGDKLSLIHI